MRSTFPMLLLLPLACTEAEVVLRLRNPHAPLPMVVTLDGEELTRSAEPAWELPIRPSRLDPAHESHGLEVSVMGPEGLQRVPARALQRVSDDSVVLSPQRYTGAGVHLCVDNRGPAPRAAPPHRPRRGRLPRGVPRDEGQARGSGRGSGYQLKP